MPAHNLIDGSTIASPFHLYGFWSDALDLTRGIGIGIGAYAPFIIHNHGTISLAKDPGFHTYGISIFGAGTVVNEVGGLIDAVIGVQIASQTNTGVGAVINYGTMASAGGNIAFTNGSPTNATARVIGSAYATLGITNYGTITGGAGTPYGPFLFNGATGVIGNGAQVDGTAINLGTINQVSGIDSGLAVHHATNVTNGQPGAAGGVISAANHGIVLVTPSAATTITNFGTIAGGATKYGVQGAPSLGTIVNGSAADTDAVISAGVLGVANMAMVRNMGTIAATADGGRAVYQSSVLINGTSGSTAGLVSGGGIGLFAVGSTNNYGTITATGTNGTGVYIRTAGPTYPAQSVTNHGIVSVAGGASSLGLFVEYGSNGIIDNRTGGTISAGGNGIAFAGNNANSTVTNAGVILATGTASKGVLGPNLFSQRAGDVVNQSSGTIAGGAYGVVGFFNTVDIDGFITGNVGIRVASLTNAGTIQGTGGTAVSLLGNARLTLLPGATFNGIVTAVSGTNSLFLGGSGALGTIAGIGTSFVNFQQVRVLAGAEWLAAGDHTLPVSNIYGALALGGGTFSGTAQINIQTDGSVSGHGTIDNVFALNGNGRLVADGGTLALGNPVVGPETRRLHRARCHPPGLGQFHQLATIPGSGSTAPTPP